MINSEITQYPVAETIVTNDFIQPLNQPIDSIIDALIDSQHKASTRRTYHQNIKYFAHYLIFRVLNKCEKIVVSQQQVQTVISKFLDFDKVTAIAYLTQYQNDLIKAEYTPNTINIRIASIRSLVKFAFNRGFCNWLVEDLKSMGNEVYRDTTGVDKVNFSQILSGIDTKTLSGTRDYAIFRLLWDCALRRSEIGVGK